jgi:Domain of unknown function (DUF4265)
MSNADHDRRGAAASRLVKVRFPLSDEDRGHGVEAENIWAECVGTDSYRIDNIPFYVYGISFDDVVCARERNGCLAFDAVRSHSGHSTYRVLIKDEAGFESPAFKRSWLILEQLGCSFEVARRRWVSIDVPPSSDVFAVYKALELGEQDAVWTFEEAHCGHDV